LPGVSPDWSLLERSAAGRVKRAKYPKIVRLQNGTVVQPLW